MPAATSVRSSRPVMVFVAVLWAFPAAPLLAMMIGAGVYAVTDDTESDAAVRLTAALILLVLLGLVLALVVRFAWRHVGRSARPAPDGSGLELRGFRFRRTVPWDDVLGVGAVAAVVDAAEGIGTLDYTTVVVRKPGSDPDRELLDARVVVVAAGFRPRPEVTATICSWFPPGHPARDDAHRGQRR